MNVEIACTLSTAQLNERRRTVLAGLRRAARAVQRVSTGWIYEFPNESGILANIHHAVELEQQCCRFLTFTVEENNDRIRLEISGPAEAQALLADLFGAVTQ